MFDPLFLHTVHVHLLHMTYFRLGFLFPDTEFKVFGWLNLKTQIMCFTNSTQHFLAVVFINKRQYPMNMHTGQDSAAYIYIK